MAALRGLGKNCSTVFSCRLVQLMVKREPQKEKTKTIENVRNFCRHWLA